MGGKKTYKISELNEEWIVVLIYLPPRTKQLTVEMNPDKNELNGNVPTKQQYTNCMTPVSTM